MNLTNEYDVFIAFHDSTGADGALQQAELLYNFLQNHGIKCFLFPESSRSSAYKANFIKIMQSRLLILVCNNHIVRVNSGEIDYVSNYHLYVELDTFFALTQTDETFKSINDSAILYFNEFGDTKVDPSPERMHALFNNRNSFFVATPDNIEDICEDVLDWVLNRLESYETNDVSNELIAILAGRISDALNRSIEGINFRRVMRRATTIKCIGISNWTFTLTDGCRKVIDALNHEKQVEMIFLDPEGECVNVRAKEEKKDTKGQIMASFDMLKSEIGSHFKNKPEKIANLKMYTFDMIPRDNLIFVYMQEDAYLFVQNYSHTLPGSACPCLVLHKLKNRESPLFDYYEGIYNNVKDSVKTKPLTLI